MDLLSAPRGCPRSLYLATGVTALASVASMTILRRSFGNCASPQDPGKRAIFISGCDSGFGYSLAIHLARDLDYRVIAGCFRSLSGDNGGKESLLSHTKDKKLLHAVDLDVTSDESIRAAVSTTNTILKDHGSELFCLVNNAAFLVFGNAEWQTKSLVQRQYEVNTMGPLRLSKAMLPHLRASRGRIVNVISNCTDCPMPTLAVYTSSKAALRSLSDGMRMELAGDKVDVILFNPGDHPFETPLCSGQAEIYDQMEREVKAIPDHERFFDYFEQCRGKFSGLFPEPELKIIDNPGFYSTFADILKADKPKVEYINISRWDRFYYGLIGMVPSWMGDALTVGLMKLPGRGKAEK